MDTRERNRIAWNRLVEKGNRWTVPVSSEAIALARKGEPHLLLTPTKFVPASWYPPLRGCKILCLAGGGGQQGPLLAASGAQVTVLDNSPRQLEQDEMVAKRENLTLKTVEGDMRDLGSFASDTFDFIFHPCSNGFCETIRPVWKEAFRVLKPKGSLVAGFANPLIYLFDLELAAKNIFQLKYPMPYSDVTSLTDAERETFVGEEPVSFGHSLEDQIAGQLEAGFHLIGLYEDDWGGSEGIDKYTKSFIATRALKV